MDQTGFEAFVVQTMSWIVQAVPNLVAGILILGAGFFLARWLGRVVSRMLEARPRFDQTLTPVIAALLRYVVLIVAIVAALGQLGIQTASILAVLGAAALAIGLALQGTLSNIAAGIMLLWLRPFRAGEAIETSTVSGTVTEIGLFATTLRASDGLYSFVPNSSLWNTPIRNLSRHGTRRIDVNLAVPAGTDIGTARRALIETARRDDRVEKEPAPQALVTGFSAETVDLVLRVWVATGVRGEVGSDLAEAGSCRLEQVVPARAAA